MPAPTHYRLTFSGVLGGVTSPPEIWSFGVSATVNEQKLRPTRTELATMAQQLQTPCWNAIGASMYSAVRLRRVRLALIGTDGRTQRDDSGAYLHGDRVTDQPALGPVGAIPPQIALAVSLLTDYPGPLGRGRFYLPMPIGNVQADTLRLSETDRAAHQQRALAFLNAVNNTLDLAGTLSYGNVAVASGGSAAKAVPPGLRFVTGVRVGAALDTMRSRRNNLLDTGPVDPVPYTP